MSRLSAETISRSERFWRTVEYASDGRIDLRLILEDAEFEVCTDAETGSRRPSSPGLNGPT